MRLLIAPLFSLLLAASLAAAPASKPTAPVWQARLSDYGEAAYAQQVEKLITTFEEATGKKLVPGAKKRAGLKVYTDSGPGMATPVPLE
jgi:hypothetical protein